jgi:hypothetical protein
MRLQSLASLNLQPNPPNASSHRDGLVQLALPIRSGATTPTPPPADSFQPQLLSQTIQQATVFLNTAPTGYTPQSLEAQFLASLLSQYFQEAKTSEGKIKPATQAFSIFKTNSEKLLNYLQTDDLQGAFTLLNGTHAPVENEFTGKYNPFKWVQNKMQAYVQEQPPHQNLSPELHSLEAFEQHVKTLRHQFQLCLGGGDTLKPSTLALKTPEALESATQQVTEQLALTRNKLATLTTLTPDAVVNEAIAHNLNTSADSMKMVQIAWLESLLNTVKNTVDSEGRSLLENSQVQRYLQGLLLVTGGSSSADGPVVLQSAIAGFLPPATAEVEDVLAPLPQKMVNQAKQLRTNVSARIQKQLGLPPTLLAQLPPEFQSLEAFRLASKPSQNKHQSADASVIAFAKTLIVSPTEQADLVQAYRLAVAQQVIQFEQQLEALVNPVAPVGRFAKQKAFLAEIPNDVRMTAQEFLANERRRFAEMLRLEASVQTALVAQIEQTVGTVRDEVFNPTETKRQLSEFQAQINQAVQTEMLTPVVERLDAIKSLPVWVQTHAQALGSQLSEVITTHVSAPLKAKVKQASTVLTETTVAVKTVLNTANPFSKVDIAADVIENKMPKLLLPTSDAVAFAKPLAIVGKQGEKLGWFSSLIADNKEWLPLALVGTAGLGLLTAAVGIGLSKSKKQSAEGVTP